MKQKLLLLAAVLCSTFSAQAVDWTGETLESGNEYYLYYPDAKVFLNANGSVGTSPENLWKITQSGSNYKINSGDNYYISIKLDVSNGVLGVGAQLTSSTAYFGTVPDGAVNDLKIIKKGDGYQIYYTKSWRPVLNYHYATGFLTASTAGIGCYGIDHGTDNPSTPTYDDGGVWYLVSKSQYDNAQKTTYSYKVTASASLECTAFLSLNSGATNGESTLTSEIENQTKPNTKVHVYATAVPYNENFYHFVGWKKSESDTEYLSTDQVYEIVVEYKEGSLEDVEPITLFAEFTQIFTDPPVDGEYVLYNPTLSVYMTSEGESCSYDENPLNATVYTLTNRGSGNQKTSTLTFNFNNETTYVAYDRGNHANGTAEFTWLIILQDNEGYRIQHTEWEGFSYNTRRISTWQDNTGHGISYPQFDVAGIEINRETNETTWMFFSKEHWQSVSANNSAVLAVNATVGYGTFVAPFDITLPTGVTAFTVTGFEGTKLTLNKVADPEGTLAANTAVILESSLENDIVETVVAQGEAYGERNEHSGEYLVGTYERTEVPVGSYLLQQQDGYTAFYLVNSTELYSGKNRAYLKNVPQEGPEGEVKAFSLNGSETAIDEIIVVNEDTAIYDLSGRRLSKKPARGIYIQNGKKILVK